MLGAAVLLVLMVVVLLPALFVGGAVVSAALGWLLADHADSAHADSPFRELNT